MSFLTNEKRGNVLLKKFFSLASFSNKNLNVSGNRTRLVECLPFKEKVIGSNPIVFNNNCILFNFNRFKTSLIISGSIRWSFYIFSIHRLSNTITKPSILAFCNTVNPFFPCLFKIRLFLLGANTRV